MKRTNHKSTLAGVACGLLILLYSYKFISLLRNGVTRLLETGGMNLSPSLKYVLACPKRYFLEKTQRHRILAPFASSVLGNEVHKRIAYSLRTQNPACTDSFTLPKRLFLQDYEDLNELCQRALDSLEFFNARCLPYLDQFEIYAIEHRVSKPIQLNGEVYGLSGVMDCIIQTPRGMHIIDWKTSSVTQSIEQLKFYLALQYLDTHEKRLSAEAISLSSGESQTVHFAAGLKDWFKDYLKGFLSDLVQCQTREARPGVHCKYCPYAQSCENSEAPERMLLDTETGEMIDLNGVNDASI